MNNTNPPSDLNQFLFPSGSPFTALWQATDIADLSLVWRSLLARQDYQKLSVVYIRFADSQSLLRNADLAGSRVMYRVPLSHQFESFTVQICRMIQEAPAGSLFLFDSLSALQTAWATDWMMINFVLVITEQLRSCHSSAFLPLMSGRHSAGALEKIRNRAELFLDIYSDYSHIFLRPEKLSHAEDPDLFLPHLFSAEKGCFLPITDGVLTSRFHKAMDMHLSHRSEGDRDSWDRYFSYVQRKYEYGEDLREDCRRLCAIMVTRDERMTRLVLENFRPEDYFFINEHMIGTGMIGGKACGMLTARKIIENHCPEIYEKLESHDSFYIGSDVFYSYIVENGFWDLRVRQKEEENYFSLGEELHKCLLNGAFSEEIRNQFLRLLSYYGQSPFIVRSSSLLEDGYDHAFAGKYESVFCPNAGSLQTRLAQLEDAVRTVYASTMSRSALDYRKRRGLDRRDEQMALLVMRVSGAYYGSYFMPCAAGVGYSYSPYKFMKNLDQSAGMLRLVMGMGTSAVDRLEGSYPRLVSLDQPQASPYTTVADRHRFSQRQVELIDRDKQQFARYGLQVIEKVLPYYLKRLLLEHDTQVERNLRERGTDREILFISCKGLVSNASLMASMRRLLGALQEEYQNPVDVEFTLNFTQNGDYMINLLQCRPLLVSSGGEGISLPQLSPEEKPLLSCTQAAMGLSRSLELDYIVYVDPIAYYHMPYYSKNQVAALLGKINWYFRGKDQKLLLFSPGRICTSSPELGVPTVFADISEFSAIAEVSETRAGYQPELSYGSHIFQDLVEAGILYIAVFDGPQTQHFHPELLTGRPSLIGELFPEETELSQIVFLWDVRGEGCRLYHDMAGEHTLITAPSLP